MRVAGNVEPVVPDHLLSTLVDHRVYQDFVAVVLTRRAWLTRWSWGRWRLVRSSSLMWRRSPMVRPMVRPMVTPLPSPVFTVLAPLLQVDWGGPAVAHC